MALAPDNATDATSLKLTRRSLLIKTSALLGVSLLPSVAGCGGDGGDTAAPPPTPAPPPAPADVRAMVSFRSVETAVPVDTRYAGLSFEKNDLVIPLFRPDNQAVIRLFGLLGPSVLRIGANQVDRSSWNAQVETLLSFGPAQIDALAAFVQATQWQMIYGVNLANNTPANAADEAGYVGERLGPSLLAWEIGNEPDLYVRNNYRPQGWGYKEFLEEWRTYRAAMSPAHPNVPFSGPATAFDVEEFNLPFPRDVEGLGMLTTHYYRGDRDDPDSTLKLLLKPDPALTSELSKLVPLASANNIPLGFRYDEANSFFGGGKPGVSNTLGAALWVMDFMFTCAIHGCTGVNLHAGGSGPGYTPIADREGRIVEVRPAFYGMVMFSRAAQGLPMESSVDADENINISAWGVERNDGGLNAILINKDERRSVGLTLTNRETVTC